MTSGAESTTVGSSCGNTTVCSLGITTVGFATLSLYVITCCDWIVNVAAFDTTGTWFGAVVALLTAAATGCTQVKELFYCHLGHVTSLEFTTFLAAINDPGYVVGTNNN